MSKQQFRFSEVSNCTSHAIEGCIEKVYIFQSNGAAYCLLANDIAAIATTNDLEITLDTEELSKWGTAPAGDMLSKDYVINAYAGIQEVAYFSLCLFEGVWMLISHRESCCVHVADSELNLLRQFFFSDPSPKDNIDDMLRPKGLVHVNGFMGICSYSVNLAEWMRKSYKYDFGKSVSPDFSSKPYLRVCPLIYKGKEVMQNISEHTLTNCGILLKSDRGNYAFVYYRRGVLRGIKKIANSVYVCGNELLLLDNETMLRVPIEAFEQQGTIALISFDGIKLKCALDLGSRYSFIVDGFQLLHADGTPVRWIGDKLSLEDIKSYGLDHDLVSSWQTDSNTTERLVPDGDTDSTDFTDPPHEKIETPPAPVLEISLNGKVGPINPMSVRTKHVESLYTNYFDKSITY